ncbi:hypothetical protein GBA52_022041 [Prunus armeniaca]|nr:hypothetical protein GBA52_022041 [Prunus armeniaca]
MEVCLPRAKCTAGAAREGEGTRDSGGRLVNVKVKNPLLFFEESSVSVTASDCVKHLVGESRCLMFEP